MVLEPVPVGDYPRLLEGEVDARVAALGQSKKMSANLPRIKMTNIGQKEGGATPAQVAEQVVSVLLKDVVNAVAKLGLEQYLGKSADEVKQQRNVELLGVQETISGELSREFLGRTVRVLVEGPSKKAHVNADGGLPQLVGRTSGDYIAVFNGPVSLAGQFADIRITETSPLTLFGKLIS